MWRHRRCFQATPLPTEKFDMLLNPRVYVDRESKPMTFAARRSPFNGSQFGVWKELYLISMIVQTLMCILHFLLPAEE